MSSTTITLVMAMQNKPMRFRAEIYRNGVYCDECTYHGTSFSDVSDHIAELYAQYTAKGCTVVKKTTLRRVNSFDTPVPELDAPDKPVMYQVTSKDKSHFPDTFYVTFDDAVARAESNNTSLFERGIGANYSMFFIIEWYAGGADGKLVDQLYHFYDIDTDTWKATIA